jgi:hypothetical protein
MLRERNGAMRVQAAVPLKELPVMKLIIAAVSLVLVVPAALAAQPGTASAPFRAGAARIDFTPEQ